MDIFLCLRLSLCYKRLQKFLNCPTRMTGVRYGNIQHHVRLIVTTVARCFSSLSAKCDGFHCQTGKFLHAAACIFWQFYFIFILSNYNGMSAYICRRFIPTTAFLVSFEFFFIPIAYCCVRMFFTLKIFTGKIRNA